MSAKHIEQHAESLLNCPVCTEKFRHSAKILPCQHTFCLPCLRRCHTAGRTGGYRLSVLNCPICRKSCPVPAGGVEALPNDFRVKQFGELVEKIQRQGEQPDDDDDGELTKCSICQFRGITRRAEIFCSSCDKNFCERCAASHRDNPVFKQHVTRPLDGGTVESEPDESRCRDHNETLSYFCEQCERAVCTVCVLVAHQQHRVVDLTDAADIQRQILDRKLDSVRAQVDNITSHRRRLEDVERLKAEARQACLAEIERLASEACELVDKRKQELIVEMNRAMEVDRDNVAEVDTKLRRAAHHLSSICDEVDRSSSAARLTHGRFVELKERIRLAVKNPEVMVGDVVDAECFRAGPRVIGDVTVSLGSVDRQSAHRQEPHHHLVEETRDDDDDVDDDASETNDDVENSDTEQSERDVTPDDDVISQVRSGHVVTENTCHVDSATAASGELIWSTSSVDYCRGVCFLSSGDVVGASCTTSSTASAGSKLQAFDSRGQFVRQLIGSVVARPWSLCYTESNDALAVTDLDSTAVKILKSTLTIRDLAAWRGAGVIRPLAIGATRSSGHYVLTDAASSSSSRVSVHAPVANRVVKVRAFTDSTDDLSPSLNYVAVDRTDRIVLSDADNAAVFIYSVDGQRLAQFKCQDERSGERMSPQGVTVDASNNMIVAEQYLSGSGGGRLARFSPDGRLIDIVVEWTEDRPWAVAYDNSQRALAVATDTALSVYRL